MTALSTFDDGNFSSEVLEAEVPVLVAFTATWCGPARMMMPMLADLSDEYAGRIKMGAVDTDQSPQLTAKYDVKALPSLRFFKQGSVADRYDGLPTKERVIGLLAPLLPAESQ